MNAQLAVRRSRIIAGDRPLGWKVGFGSQSAMDALGIDQPLIGNLLHSGVVQSDSELKFSDFTRLAIEPEIAVYLNAELGGDTDKETIKAAISGLGPAIEIADVFFPPTSGPEKILAENIYQKGVVLGRVDESRAGAELGGLAVKVRCNCVDLLIPDDLESNTGPILDLVAVVADTLAAMDERLKAGELIIVGSIIPPLVLDAAADITLVFGDAEPISIKVI